MLATADFNAMQIAYLATECAARHVLGESVPAKVELPVEIVDHDNYSHWDWPYAQRGLRTLEQMGLAL
jgi:ribose transport system substrate-binding protein